MIAHRQISKSDFLVGRDCPMKLHYKKMQYPSLKDDDPYLELLADGGFMVGKIAQMLHSEGFAIHTLDSESACAETLLYLARKLVTLFEGAIETNGLLARFDILKKINNCFELIEVKSKGIDLSTPRKHGPFLTDDGEGILADWRRHLEDVAFQRHVLRLKFPKAKIRCFLLLPDKSKSTQSDGLAAQFSIHRQDGQVSISFSGEEDLIRRNPFLVKISVDEEVDRLQNEITRAAKQFSAYARKGFKRPSVPIGYHCRGCEYKVLGGTEPNGFVECWKSLAKPKPHLFDLYHLGAIKTPDKKYYADQLIEQRKTSLFDVDPELCVTKFGERQKIQIKYSKCRKEWIAPELTSSLDDLHFPLHFIDFETSRLAVPSHHGMRPFEQVAFQWSCHTLLAERSRPKHAEWINLDRRFPNIVFAETLRTAVGDTGAILTWSHHEATTIREIMKQMDRLGPRGAKLKSWWETQLQSGRFVDLCELTESYYFHPDMGGKLSIKQVLPAVWGTNPSLHKVPWLKKYYRKEDGQLLNPYKTLPPFKIFDQAEVVNEGTGAMRAYQEMLYGESSSDPKEKAQWAKLLLQYCCLDTLAMVIIWKHWRSQRLKR